MGVALSCTLFHIFLGVYMTALSLHTQSPEGEKAAEMAIREPWKFVLKPEKEGGGVWRDVWVCGVILLGMHAV